MDGGVAIAEARIEFAIPVLTFIITKLPYNTTLDAEHRCLGIYFSGT
jgi:hypothetical protein